MKGSCLVVLNGNRPRTLREHTPIVMCDLTLFANRKAATRSDPTSLTRSSMTLAHGEQIDNFHLHIRDN